MRHELVKAAEIVKVLGGQWHGNQGMAHCPVHDDHNASLAILKSEDRVLVHCHAGCDQQSVIAALRSRGLWSGNEAPRKVTSPRAASEERTQAARRIWSAARSIDGTTSGTYLRQRGITIDLPAKRPWCVGITATREVA